MNNIKMSPLTGLAGFGGGPLGLTLGGAKVWVEGAKQDLDFEEESSLNYNTSGSNSVDTATTNNNNTVTAKTSPNRWCMGIAESAVDTDRPTSISFMASQSPYPRFAFGFGKRFATGHSFSNTVRHETGAYGIYWNNELGNVMTPGGHGTSISGMGADEIEDMDYTKITLNPLTSVYEVRLNDVLVQSGTLSASFVSQITAGNIFAICDQYGAGYVALHKYPWT